MYYLKLGHSFQLIPVNTLFKTLLIILLFYIYTFQPPVINKLFYIGLEFVFFLIFISINSVKFIKMIKMFKLEIMFIVIIIIYALFRDIISGEIVYSDRFIAWFFQSFLMGSIILIIFEDNRESLFNYIYWASFIAALLSTLLFFSISFDNWYKSIQIDSYYETYASFEHRYRAYGISENLTFTYAVVMGIFSGYSFYNLKKNYLFILPFFIFLFATIINARTGMIAILFFMFYTLLKSPKSILRFLIFILILTI